MLFLIWSITVMHLGNDNKFYHCKKKRRTEKLVCGTWAASLRLSRFNCTNPRRKEWMESKTESRESVQQSNKSLEKVCWRKTFFFHTVSKNVWAQQQQVHADVILPHLTSASNLLEWVFIWQWPQSMEVFRKSITLEYVCECVCVFGGCTLPLFTSQGERCTRQISGLTQLVLAMLRLAASHSQTQD